MHQTVEVRPQAQGRASEDNPGTDSLPLPGPKRWSLSSGSNSITLAQFQSSFGKSMSARMDRMESWAATYAFSSPSWLLLPVLCSYGLAIVFVALAYCQGLESVPIPAEVMSADMHEAARLFQEPETYTPCYDKLQGSCTPNYIYIGIFLLMATFSLIIGICLTQAYCIVSSHPTIAAAVEMANESAAARDSCSRDSQLRSSGVSVGSTLSAPANVTAAAHGSAIAKVLLTKKKTSAPNSLTIGSLFSSDPGNTTNTGSSSPESSFRSAKFNPSPVSSRADFNSRDGSNHSNGHINVNNNGSNNCRQVVSVVPGEVGSLAVGVAAAAPKQESSTLSGNFFSGAFANSHNESASAMARIVNLVSGRQSVHQGHASVEHQENISLLKRFRRFSRKLRPGAELFWYRALWSLITEMTMQSVRGFGLEESYARTSAGQTMSQILIMIVQVNIFSVMFVARSEVGYVISNFMTECMFLIVRLSMHGPLSMSCKSTLDFATMLLPMTVCTFEMLHIFEFILNPISVRREQSTKSSASSRRPVLIFAFLVTTLGFVLMYIVFRKGYLEECPKNSADWGSNSGEVNYESDQLLVDGVNCYFWRFNLFVAPACACIVLEMQPFYSSQCAGLGSNDHVAINALKPHLEFVSFLFVGQSTSEVCTLTDKDAELIGSFKHLRVLQMDAFPWRDFPESFRFEEIVSVIIRASRMRTIGSGAVASYQKLEFFECTQCPWLDTYGDLYGHLPRLQHVHIYGVEECSPMPHVPNFRCVSRNAVNTCETIPEWYLRQTLHKVELTLTQKCAEPFCSRIVRDYTQSDFRHDGVISLEDHNVLQTNVRGFDMDYQFPIASALGFECFTKLIKLHNRWDRPAPNLYEYADGFLMHEYIMMYSTYTGCGECDYLQDLQSEYFATFDRIKDEAQVDHSDLSIECNNVLRVTQFDPNMFQGLCSNPNTECLGVCHQAFLIFNSHDHNNDWYINEQEFYDMAHSVGGASFYPEGLYSCLREVAPACFSANNSEALTYGSGLLLGLTVLQQDAVSTCSDCENFPVPDNFVR